MLQVVQRFMRVAESGLFAAPVEQPLVRLISASATRDEIKIDGRHRLGLSLAQPGLQNGGDSAQPARSTASERSPPSMAADL